MPDEARSSSACILLKRFQTTLFVLMSACLRRAPWKRSVGSCWTAKGASSGEVSPPTPFPTLRLLSVVVPEAVNAHSPTRQDTGRQTGGTPLSCLLSTRWSRSGPMFSFLLLLLIAYLNAVTRFRYKKKRTVSQHPRLEKKYVTPNICFLIFFAWNKLKCQQRHY